MRFDDVKQVEQALQGASYSPITGWRRRSTWRWHATAAPARGRARCGQDGGRENALPDHGVGADPAAVLRGHRRLAGALRVGLLAPAPVRPGAARGRLDVDERVKGSTGRSSFSSGRCSRQSAPAPAPCCRRRARPGRRRVRGLPARGALRLPGHRPQLGTIAPGDPPAVVITSNRTRELHDALKRRCLYHWIDFPDLAREIEIIKLRVPGVSEQLARAVATAVAALRSLDLIKPPGAAEAIDWAQALSILGADSVTGTPGSIRSAGR